MTEKGVGERGKNVITFFSGRKLMNINLKFTFRETACVYNGDNMLNEMNISRKYP